MADLSGAAFQDNTIFLRYCNLPLEITHPQGEINFLERGKNSKIEGRSPEGLSSDEKVVILQYLTRASGLPVRGQWLSFLDLRGTAALETFSKRGFEPLAKNSTTKGSLKLALSTEAPLEQGDAGVVIICFPRIPWLLYSGMEGRIYRFNDTL